LLGEKKVKAIFFVLGGLAEKYPELVKRIFDEGHEIASHGYSHKSLNNLGEESFEREIFLTNNILKEITGQSPTKFRSPAFSLKKQMKWAGDILDKHGLEHVSAGPAWAGGIYFRVMPLRLFLLYLKAASKRKTPILYFHPHELFDFVPRIKNAPWIMKKIKYAGTKNALNKFEKLLNELC